jgi:peroxiredoxin
VQALALALAGGGLVLLELAALLLWPKSTAPAEEPRTQPQAVNFAAPELELNDLNGAARALADYRGQVVLVNNWATWCPPCRAEMPTLQAYYQKHQAQGFVLVAVEAGEPADEVTRFVEEYGLTFPVWLDPHSLALDAFRNDTLPSSYVIDRAGVVRFTWNGAISAATLEKYVTPLLKE